MISKVINNLISYVFPLYWVVGDDLSTIYSRRLTYKIAHQYQTVYAGPFRTLDESEKVRWQIIKQKVQP